MRSNNKVIRFMMVVGMVVAAIAGQAQNNRDSLMKLVVKDVCEELSTKNLSGKNMDELQMEIGMAFMPALMKHKDALEKELGGDITDKAGMEKLGQAIGMRLFTECPAFLKIMGDMDPSALDKPTKIPVTIGGGASIKGTLLKVVPGELTHLLVKDSKGKTVKIWWMDYFDGSDDMADNPQKMINKKVTVDYTEKEVYNVALKQYIKIKVATGISF
jgi:hypothetical protein